MLSLGGADDGIDEPSSYSRGFPIACINRVATKRFAAFFAKTEGLDRRPLFVAFKPRGAFRGRKWPLEGHLLVLKPKRAWWNW